MPINTEWVAPETVLIEEGPDGPVTVYHAYKNDDMAQGRHTYHFTLYEISDTKSFDIRDLAREHGIATHVRMNSGEQTVIHDALRHFIRTGVLKKPTEDDDG